MNSLPQKGRNGNEKRMERVNKGERWHLEEDDCDK